MLLKGAYCVGEHFVDPHSSRRSVQIFHIMRIRPLTVVVIGVVGLSCCVIDISDQTYCE